MRVKCVVMMSKKYRRHTYNIWPPKHQYYHNTHILTPNTLDFDFVLGALNQSLGEDFLRKWEDLTIGEELECFVLRRSRINLKLLLLKWMDLQYRSNLSWNRRSVSTMVVFFHQAPLCSSRWYRIELSCLSLYLLLQSQQGIQRNVKKDRHTDIQWFANSVLATSTK